MRLEADAHRASLSGRSALRSGVNFVQEVAGTLF
jgi:hypothetical protein